MDGIELGFQVVYGMAIAMLIASVLGAIVWGWWGWKNKDWLIPRRR